MASSNETAVGKRLPDSTARRVFSGRVDRALACSDHEIRAHHEAQPYQVLTGLVELLVKVRQHADQLMTYGVEAHMGIAASQQFACNFGNRRGICDPGATAVVGEAKMDPDPASAGLGERRVHLFIGDRLGAAVSAKAIGPDDAGCGGGDG